MSTSIVSSARQTLIAADFPSDKIAVMTVTFDYQRPASRTHTALEDRFEVIKEIGDGSFGSVALARVRANGANVARRGSLVSVLR